MHSQAESHRTYDNLPEDILLLPCVCCKMFSSLYERLKLRQITHYAFLNKEFNTMNYKSARCSMHCFDSAERPLKEVNNCLSVCREGI